MRFPTVSDHSFHSQILDQGPTTDVLTTALRAALGLPAEAPLDPILPELRLERYPDGFLCVARLRHDGDTEFLFGVLPGQWGPGLEAGERTFVYTITAPTRTLYERYRRKHQPQPETRD